MITRRKDKQQFALYWRSIHERCFQIRKEERWLEMRRKIRGEVERKNKPKLLLLSSHNFGSEITDFSNI